MMPYAEARLQLDAQVWTHAVIRCTSAVIARKRQMADAEQTRFPSMLNGKRLALK